jgi:hypothetical protein
MANSIQPHHINTYLNYLCKRLGKLPPDPYNDPAFFLPPDPAGIAAKLVELYKALGISNQRGWAIEARFLQEYVELADLDGNKKDFALNTPAQYRPISAAIGRHNYRAYLHRLGEYLNRPLEHMVGDWGQLDDEGIRQAIQRLYAEASITTKQAESAEAAFIQEYAQSKKHQAPFQHTTSDTRQQQRQSEAGPAGGQPRTADKAAQTSAAPTYERGSNTVRPIPAVTPLATRKRTRSKWLVGLACIAISSAGIWVYARYQTFAGLPYVYPLTDNIAVRNRPDDSNVPAGRMDMFGQYPDGRGGELNSATQYRLADKDLENGYFRVMETDGFLPWLLGKKENERYVYASLVTTDPEEYEQSKRIFANLRGDFNELDKLGIMARQFIIRSLSSDAGASALEIAASCAPNRVVSKTAPLAVFKFANKSSDELIVIFQATDGQCYYLRAGKYGFAQPVPVKVTGGGSLKAGGVFTLNKGKCIFETCGDKRNYTALYPFTEFTVSDRFPG